MEMETRSTVSGFWSLCPKRSFSVCYLCSTGLVKQRFESFANVGVLEYK